ncbi:uncharacterized protein [Fopius arisanus]|uniref:Uncharacterized protein n=1 Tax=Fopius arisanus TaxID=64838 RepID=A0A9R1TNF5_9HYME|nr:PREDICTED: uncharacterized protein LOC105272329 [Fopius arisanus]
MYTDILEKCVKLWNLTRSPKQYEVIVELLGKALKRPVVTRWNSFYDAYEQIVQLKDKVLYMVDKLNIKNSLVTSDFIFLKEYVKCTAPIAKALNRLQGDVTIGYGWLLPTLISTKNDLIDLEKEYLIYCKPVIKVLLSSLDKRFSNYFTVVDQGKVAAVATATHPKFKLKWLHCLDETAQANVMVAIKEAIAASTKSSTTNIFPMEIDNDDFNFGSREAAMMTAQQNLETGAGETEFRRYCQDPKSSLAILLAYPTVKNIFIKSNTLLPSSASVERITGSERDAVAGSSL